jgi:hypothetical protein
MILKVLMMVITVTYLMMVITVTYLMMDITVTYLMMVITVTYLMMVILRVPDALRITIIRYAQNNHHQVRSE